MIRKFIAEFIALASFGYGACYLYGMVGVVV